MTQDNSNNVVVETTGDFMLQDVTSVQTVEAHRPSLVKRTSFISARLDKGDLRMVDDAPADDLTDQKIADQWEATGKFKGSKKVKAAVVKVPEPAANKETTPVVTAKKPIPPGAGKQPGESEDEFKARVAAEVNAQ